MLNLIFDTHTRAKLVQYLIEKAEAIFLRAKYRHGQESEAKAAELLDVAQTQRADADKSEVLSQTFDATADAQREFAKTKREQAAKIEMLGHKLKAKANAQYEIAKVRREGADESETTGTELEAKAVEIQTGTQRKKKKNP